MPTATDLVTDLPADFAVFGQGVDTTMADLKGGTTGQVLAKATATDMDFNWITPELGDITAVNAGTGISGGGTTGAVTITNSMATAMTTSGDLIQATGSGTFARLGTGTNGQYLTTNGTTNSWAAISAGGMTLISTTTLTGASVVISSIPATYNNLRLVIKNYLPASSNASINCSFNNDTTASRHAAIGTFGSIGATAFTGTNFQLVSGANNSTTQSLTIADFADYANTTTWKTCAYLSISNDNTTATSFKLLNQTAFYNQTGAVSSLGLTPNTGNFTSGTAYLYGVK